jgi:DNA-binding response OmpR family regulator
MVLIVEDDELIQGMVEDALKEGSFETAIAPSAEEAVTLLKGRVMDYRALVTDINLKGHMNGWGRRKTRSRDRSRVPDRLHDGSRRK